MHESLEILFGPSIEKGRFQAVPLCYQETEYTCGVACTQSLLARYGVHYSQSDLMEILGSRPFAGTDPQKILHFLGLLGFAGYMAENLSIDDLMGHIDSGAVPMLSLQAWKGDPIPYREDWRDPHYVLACGYREGAVLLMDPYTLGNYAYLSFSDLSERWHVTDFSGVRHERAALIFPPEGHPVYYRPQAVVPMA